MTAAPAELLHFLLLPADQQAQTIRRMAAAGWTDQGLAAATRLSVEQIRRVLSPDTPAKCQRTGVPVQFCTCVGPHGVAA